MQNDVDWKCPACDQWVKALEQVRLLDEPTNLVLQFHRALPHGKDQSHVAYGPTLDLSSCMPGHLPPALASGGVAPAGPPHYKLCAVVVHHGEDTRSGHYTTFFRRGAQWWVDTIAGARRVGFCRLTADDHLIMIQYGAATCLYGGTHSLMQCGIVGWVHLGCCVAALRCTGTCMQRHTDALTHSFTYRLTLI